MNKKLAHIFFNRKMLLCIYTGFCSGLPFFFIIQLIPAWLKVGGVDIKTIGAFALTQIPYLCKFLWSPLLDKMSPFSLGYRKGWLFLTQLGLLIIMPMYGFLTPQDNIKIVVALSLLTAFISATQDIAIDAYRREILSDNELGSGNSIHINIYRISGFVPGGLSLVLADYLSWMEVFVFTAAFFIPILLITIRLKEPSHISVIHSDKSIFKQSINEFIHRQSLRNTLFIIAFISFYKLGDSLATSLTTPFYLDMNFEKRHIGTVVKNAAVWPSLLGAFLGGFIISKYGLNRSLWISGFVQMFSILGFAFLSYQGPFLTITYTQLITLATVISFESIGVGMGSAALVTFISKKTSPLFTTTQFALLTGFSAIPRTLINSTSGVLTSHLGWTNFFWLCFILAFPGMLLLLKVAPWNSQS
ncbi:AmpG family muropeptide MFS transporter [Gilliamella sp. Bif1-4]|uniref:AmpG family muropeptide MFS transporter n=1 Tax=Gilliamella sp. Bif1-4 TaxID=3120233 RepID=UPI00080E15F6|nr:MFS transporter [Gilliamella apicola]OCG41908.1 AmpG family muropeptide MFS transporter [Gilliamella apicola]